MKYKFPLVIAINFLSLGVEILVVYQVKLHHLVDEILNNYCYLSFDGPQNNIVGEGSG